MKTRAAVLYGPTRQFQVEELELDEPKAGEVLVKMVATGMCHSDWHFASGDFTTNYPIVTGHEGAGIVEQVGPGVTEVQPGDHVILTFIPSCGKCRWCLTGLPVLCDRGANITGGALLDGTFRLHTVDGRDVGQLAGIGCFSEYIVAPVETLIRLEPDIPLDKACLVACCVPTGFGAATKRAEVRPGDVVAVFGLGGVGMNAVQGAALAGASKVIAVDLVPWKLEAAQEFGATHTINAQYEDPVQRILDLTNGVGADKTIVTIGHVEPEHIGIAYRATRKSGRTVVVGLTPQNTDWMKVPPADLVLLGKEVVGTLYGHVNPRVDFPYLLQLYRAGRLKLDELVTKTYRLEEINQGYADLLEGRVIRGVILFDEAARS